MINSFGETRFGIEQSDGSIFTDAGDDVTRNAKSVTGSRCIAVKKEIRIPKAQIV